MSHSDISEMLGGWCLLPDQHFSSFISDERGGSTEGEPGTSACGHREKQQLGLATEETTEEVALSSVLESGGNGLGEGVPGRRSLSSAQERGNSCSPEWLDCRGPGTP